MDILKIESTRINIPGIVLDPQSGILEFTGNSVLHDGYSFYKPVQDWVTQYTASPKSKTLIVCRLGVLNSVSQKVIYNILKTFKQMKAPYLVEVNWYYEMDDFDSEDQAEDFQQAIEMDNFKIIGYTP